MAYNWGKYINGRVFVENEFVARDEGLICIEDFEEKESFEIKEIFYEEFPGIEKGYSFSNYWENTENGIIQKWKKKPIPMNPVNKLKIDYRYFVHTTSEIFEIIKLLEENNNKELQVLFRNRKIIKPIYERAAELLGDGKVYSTFLKEKYSIKRLFEEIGLHKYLIDGGLIYNEEVDCYFNEKEELVIDFCYIKNSFFIIDSLKNFTTIGNTAYLKMAYTYLYTLFDDFLLKAIETVARLDSRTMIRYVGNISSKVVIECENKDDLIETMLSNNLYLMGWKSFKEKIQYFEDAGIHVEGDLDDIIVISEKRNILVHNQGIVNLDFIKKISGTKYKENFKINDKIIITKSVLEEDSKKISENITNIFEMICEKYLLLK